MAKNAFDELLESVADSADRKALEDIAGKYPDLKSSVLRQSDYSRKMDQLAAERRDATAKLESLSNWEKWASENYEYNAYGTGQGATKKELEWRRQAEEAATRARELEGQISVGGEVTFDQVNDHFNKLMSDRGLDKAVRAEDVDRILGERTKPVLDEIGNSLAGYLAVSKSFARLSTQHYKDFGEVLDTDKLWDEAVGKGYKDLNKAYDDFVKPLKDSAASKDVEDRIAKAREEARAEALKERGMGGSGMPTDGGSPQMGPLAQLAMGIGKDGDKPNMDSLELGRGSIASVAARDWGKE